MAGPLSRRALLQEAGLLQKSGRYHVGGQDRGAESLLPSPEPQAGCRIRQVDRNHAAPAVE